MRVLDGLWDQWGKANQLPGLAYPETPYRRDLPLQHTLSFPEARVRDETGPWGRDPTSGLMLTYKVTMLAPHYHHYSS